MKHRRFTHVVMWALGTLLVTGGWSPRSVTQPPVDWTNRLEMLDSEDPMAYFELAEEVADGAINEADMALARHLFGLAGVLDTPGLGRSACLALADFESQAHTRQRLLAMASLLQKTRGLTDFAPLETEAVFSVSTAISVSRAFSYYRLGQGSRALSELRRPGAMDLLQSIDHLLRGGAQRFTEDCRLYKGQVRPTLMETHRSTMLRTELALLAGEDRSWSGELLISGGRPLIELDPNQIQDLLGVDPSRSRFRNGRWVRNDPGP